MRFLKSSALVAAVLIGAGVLAGVSCVPSCRPRPDAGLPVRPERFKPEELGPSVKEVIRKVESRLPADQRSPDDVLEPIGR